MGLADSISINTHSSIRIEGSKVLYFDPFEIAEGRGDADIIFVTHGHYDHYDPKSIAKIKKADTIIVAPESMKKQVSENDVTGDMQAMYYLPGTAQEIGEIKVEAVAAYNRLKPFHPKSKGWLGYVVTMDSVRYYVAGDTDPNEDNKKVSCDVALIPIGGTYTMGKKHAADFIAEIGPQVVIPTHYGSVIGKPTDGNDLKELLESMGSKVEVVVKIHE